MAGTRGAKLKSLPPLAHSGHCFAQFDRVPSVRCGAALTDFDPDRGVVAGVTPREVLELLRGLKGLDFVGGDVVEVAPQYDSTTNTAHIAAQVLFTILCLIVKSPVSSA